MPPQQLELLSDRQLVHSTTIAWMPGSREAVCNLSKLTRIFIGRQYTIRVVDSDTVHPLAKVVIPNEGETIAELPVHRRSYSLTATLRSRDELPLPLGIKVQVRHKYLDLVVASGMCSEGEMFEDHQEEAFAARAALAAKQTAEAASAVRQLMEDNDVYFNG